MLPGIFFQHVTYKPVKGCPNLLVFAFLSGIVSSRAWSIDCVDAISESLLFVEDGDAVAAGIGVFVGAGA
jgi:hypothetical protein